MSKKSVAITRRFETFSVPYASTPEWDDCECNLENDGSLTVTMRRPVIDNTEETKKEILGLFEEFELALRYKGHHKLSAHLVDVQVDDCDDNASVNDGIIFGDDLVDEVQPRQPEAKMPRVPLACKRWIYTYSETNGVLASFVAEQLIRHYLIIEELGSGNEQEEELRIMRNFVSHPRCDDDSVVEFIKDNFESAISVNSNGNEYAAFDHSNVHHGNFVSKYEAKARDQVCRLIDEQIEGHRN